MEKIQFEKGIMELLEECERLSKKESITTEEQSFIRATLKMAMPISCHQFENPDFSKLVEKTGLIAKFMIFNAKVV